AEAATCKRSHLQGRHHQIARWIYLSELTDAFSLRGACRRGQSLHLRQYCRYGAAPLLERFKRIIFEAHFGQIELAVRTIAKRGHDRIVKHATAIEIRGCNEKRRRQT